MIENIVALIEDEGKWLTASMGIALLAVSVLLLRSKHSDLPAPRRVMAAMNLFVGMTLGSMAFGHLLAVTTKLIRGVLEGPTLVFYVIGIVLAVPSWWIIHHTRAILTPDSKHGQRTLALNGWLAITLLALGLHNLPLAAPAFLNIGYQLHSRRWVGWVLAGTAIVVNLGLFVGSLIFMASGQSFEQFRGME